ncbi:hypothetical protein LUZ60_003212 [Juncus effusus]|nr:hypothetical protein LUZ60_003212 [Juncus effusus]
MASLLLLTSLILHLLSFSESSSSKLVLEEGYTVSTLLDFNKLHYASDGGIHPFSLLPLSNSDDLVLLDSSSSTFYTLSLPSSEDAEARVKVLAGNGKLGFSDGESKDVSFNKPKSFAVDEAGNVYVADRLNYVIRKIDKSGFTTTIAGGKARKIGNTDGPAQNASFSNEFELVYFSKMCSLLVVDRGNNLIRQINLNSKDCTNKSHKSGLGIASISVISILCVLFGSVLGFVARPFLNFRAGSFNQPPAQQDMESIPDQSGESNTDTLLRRQKRNC